MTTFDEREQAFEGKFEHDLQLDFRVRSRRDKLAGLWAAEILGLGEGRAEAYAEALVTADITTTGPHDILHRLLGDFMANGVDISAHRVGRKLDQLTAEARRQVFTE